MFCVLDALMRTVPHVKISSACMPWLWSTDRCATWDFQVLQHSELELAAVASAEHRIGWAAGQFFRVHTRCYLFGAWFQTRDQELLQVESAHGFPSSSLVLRW